MYMFRIVYIHWIKNTLRKWRSKLSNNTGPVHMQKFYITYVLIDMLEVLCIYIYIIYKHN